MEHKRREAKHQPGSSAFTLHGRISEFIRRKGDEIPALSVPSEGRERIWIELKDDPKKAAFYADKYDKLVSSIADVLRDTNPDSSPNPILASCLERIAQGEELWAVEKKYDIEINFITAVWEIMHSNLDIDYGRNKFDFLYESLQSGEFNCSTSAFLTYDVARELKINANLVFISWDKDKSGHALVVFENVAFETTSGSYFSVERLPEIYPEFQTANGSQVHGESYNVRGLYHFKMGNYAKAVKDLREAVRLNPQHEGLRQNLSDFDTAYRRYLDSLRSSPFMRRGFSPMQAIPVGQRPNQGTGPATRPSQPPFFRMPLGDGAKFDEMQVKIDLQAKGKAVFSDYRGIKRIDVMSIADKMQKEGKIRITKVTQDEICADVLVPFNKQG